jgi:hypothetical protein
LQTKPTCFFREHDGEGAKLESVNDIRSKFDEDSTIHKVYEEEEEVREINKVNFKVDNENIAGL